MKTPLDIVIERMKSYDPTYLIEVLDITSEDIIARFMDVIYDKEEYLQGEFEVFLNTDDPEMDVDESDLHEIMEDTNDEDN